MPANEPNTGLFWHVRSLVVAARGELKRHRHLFLLLPLLVASAACFMLPHDAAWTRDLLEHRSDRLRAVARRFSAYGDFPTGTLAVVGSLWIVGWLKRSPRLKTAALACLLSATLAGATATTIRSLTGRPRPSTNVPDQFHGPSLEREYQSFGSAHAATSLGTTTALAIAVPPIGVPVFVLSLGVPWSRFYMRDHYVADLVVGGGIGIWFGLAFGLAARRRGQSTL
jgi:membrane-associated phospholipid phosphatase